MTHQISAAVLFSSQVSSQVQRTGPRETAFRVIEALYGWNVGMYGPRSTANDVQVRQVAEDQRRWQETAPTGEPFRHREMACNPDVIGTPLNRTPLNKKPLVTGK